jgi:hypothetical protein
VKFVLPNRRRRGEYTVTDARRSMSEDISYRQRRYLISMGVRVVAFLLAVFLFHGIWRFIAAAIALVVPYFAVVFANGGREPDNRATFESFEPNLPDRRDAAGGSLAVPGSPDGASGGGDADGRTRADEAGRDGTGRDGTGRTGTGGGGTYANGADGDGPFRDGAPGDGARDGTGADDVAGNGAARDQNGTRRASADSTA